MSDPMDEMAPESWRVWAEGDAVVMAVSGYANTDEAFFVRVSMTRAQAIEAARALEEAAGLKWATA